MLKWISKILSNDVYRWIHEGVKLAVVGKEVIESIMCFFNNITATNTTSKCMAKVSSLDNLVANSLNCYIITS